MKKLKLFMAAMIAAITVAGMSGVQAAAASVTVGTTPANHEFTISRTITKAKNAITNTFGYTITADSNNLDGVTGFPTTATVAFNNVSPESGTATATGTIDLSGVKFTKNGDYTWTVTETSSTDATNYPVQAAAEKSYKIRISVRNTSSTNLSSDQAKEVTIFGYEVGAGTNGADQKLAQPTMPFTSETQYKHIEIKKEVTGNMADVDKCFDVDVTISGSGTYTVSGGCSNPASITAGSATTLSLKHNDTIIIGRGTNEEMPINLEYSYAEKAATNYTQVSGASVTDKKVSSTDATNVNQIVNNYESATITGAFLNVLPYVVIVAIAVAGVVYLVIRNKKQKEVEE